MKKIAAIMVTICMAVTGTCTGIPQMALTGDDMTASAASYPALKTINYTATGNQRDDIIGFAKTQVGYKEKGSNNTYFGAWYGCNYNPWCAMFVCWSAAKAGVPTSVIPKLATADRGWAKKQGVYYKSKYWGGSYTPQKGDLIYFSWSVKDWADHIGMVSGTGKSGGTTYVYTIEGNKHDKVTEGSYAINNRYILGYASPKYNTGNTTTTTTTTTAATTYTVNYNANGGTGAPAAQKKTKGKELTLSTTQPTRTNYAFQGWAKSSSATTVEYTSGAAYTTDADVTLYAVWKADPYDAVTTSSVNVRSGPGTDQPVQYVLGPGTEISITETSGNWAKLTDGNWIMRTYISREDTPDYTLEYTDGRMDTTDDTTVIPMVTVTYGSTVTLSTTKFQRPGYHYNLQKVFRLSNGEKLWLCKDIKTWKKETWAKQNAIPSGYRLVQVAPGKQLTVRTPAGDRLFITPLWEADVYTVTYNANGGKNAPDKQTKKYNKTLKLKKKKPTREGYKFKGWGTSAGTKTVSYTSGSKYTGNANLALYAVWKSTTFKVKTTETIHKRSGPGLDYDVKGTVKKGKTVTIIKKKNGWGKLKKSGYWISLKFTEKVKKKDSKKKEETKNNSNSNSSASSSDGTVFTVKVISENGVNARSGPSKNDKVVGSFEKGKTLKIKDVRNGWGQLKKSGNWIKLKYTKIIDGYKVKVTVSDLNMRKGPGTQYDVVDTIPPGTYEISKVKGDWGKVRKTGTWIYLPYTTRVK